MPRRPMRSEIQPARSAIPVPDAIVIALRCPVVRAACSRVRCRVSFTKNWRKVIMV